MKVPASVEEVAGGLRDVGFAYYYQKGSAYGSYWTQDFATPL